MRDAPFPVRLTEMYLPKLVQQNCEAASEEKNTDPHQSHGVPEVALHVPGLKEPGNRQCSKEKLASKLRTKGKRKASSSIAQHKE